jgi:NADPH-dependent glutamate synthase beta chain and related oxidoreductases
MPQNNPAAPSLLTQLEENFADIAPPLTADAALVESSKCLFCHDAPCMIACPTHIDVPSFIKKIMTGNLRGSARTILDANPMGHSCARACPVEVLCEGACVLNDRDEEPIKIALLQRYATDYALEKNLRLFEPGPDNGKKVAIIGAGPAGLSSAQDLRRMGYAVTIFDAHPVPGGLNTYGIAEYKMRPPVALAEAKMILALGVELKSGIVVGTDISFEELRSGFDAVLVAVGLAGTRRLGIPGEDLPGVMDALQFIEHLKTHSYDSTPVGQHVVVVGAGNTAIDAVTQAKRLGAVSSTIVYRRGEDEMPAYDYEFDLAKKDGCEFRFFTVPKRVLGEKHVTGLECVRSEIGPRGKDGKHTLVEIPNSTHVVECDMLMRATGQGRNAELLKSAGVTIQDGKVVSTLPNVFVAGDCLSGGAEIVNAAADGKEAALQINTALGGKRAVTQRDILLRA